MKQGWVIFLTLFIFPACTKTVWIHPEKNQSQYGPDRWNCEQEVAMRSAGVATGGVGKLRWASKSEPEEKDIDRCMIMKYGWEKKEVPK